MTCIYMYVHVASLRGPRPHANKSTVYWWYVGGSFCGSWSNDVGTESGREKITLYVHLFSLSHTLSLSLTSVCIRQRKTIQPLYFLSPSSEALQVATFIRKNAKKQTTRFSGNLEIGSSLKIPIKIFTKVSRRR